MRVLIVEDEAKMAGLDLMLAGTSRLPLPTGGDAVADHWDACLRVEAAIAGQNSFCPRRTSLRRFAPG